MNFIKNDNGKIILHNKNGQIVLFDYAVDANEALMSVDENGKSNYSMPELKSKIKAKTEKIDPEDLISVKKETKKEDMKEE